MYSEDCTDAIVHLIKLRTSDDLTAKIKKSCCRSNKCKYAILVMIHQLGCMIADIHLK